MILPGPRMEMFMKEFRKTFKLEHSVYQRVTDTEFVCECLSPFIIGPFAVLVLTCFGNDLDYLKNRNLLKPNADLCTQMLRCCNYLASKNVIHLDIKPNNFLISDC